MQTWPFKSKSSDKDYTTVLTDDGKLGCNCKGYTVRRGDSVRECTHMRDVIKIHKFDVEVRGGEFVYVKNPQQQLPILSSEGVKVQNETAPSSDVPFGYIQPMLAEALLDGSELNYAEWLDAVRVMMDKYLAQGYVCEKKYDGHRKIVYVDKNGVRAWSRPKSGAGKVGLPSQLPSHIVKELRQLVTGRTEEQSAYGTYDCELVGGSETDMSSDVTRLDKEHERCLVIFDVLHLSNMKVPRLPSGNQTKLPYRSRRQILTHLFNLTGVGLKHVRLSEVIDNATFDHVKKIWDNGGEGAMLKDPDSTYQPGRRSTTWLKIKKLEPVPYIITGYEAGKNGPYSKVTLKEKNNPAIKTSAKTKNNAWLKRFAADPDKYIGEELVCIVRGRHPSGKPRHCMWDHLVNYN
jgi:ATP-dependent DNA ligase